MAIETSIGFTGTGHQPLMNEQRRMLAAALLEAWNTGYREFHHGDCVHADAEAHDIAYEIGFSIVIHPPSATVKRAFKGYADTAHGVLLPRVTVLLSKQYLERNHDIVDASNYMLACPQEFKEQLRSGTWATVRYARKQSKRVEMIWPEP